MAWFDYYKPSSSVWQGRKDLPANACFFQTIKSINLLQPITAIMPNQLAFGLIGFCCDEGIKRNFGRVGAFQGPLVIREALAKLPMKRPDVICFDAGDIFAENGDLERAQEGLGEAVYQLLSNHITPIIMGGGHELAWGHYQGIVKKYSKESLSIINFDAHFDMRPLLSDGKGSSGTPFFADGKSLRTST